MIEVWILILFFVFVFTDVNFPKLKVFKKELQSACQLDRNLSPLEPDEITKGKILRKRGQEGYSPHRRTLGECSSPSPTRLWGRPASGSRDHSEDALLSSSGGGPCLGPRSREHRE